MASRIELQSLLESILGTRNVYYQPPMSVQISYPAIIYSRNRIDNDHANNGVYRQSFSYDLTVIDKRPDSEIVYAISKLPMCRHNRHYVADNLDHDNFTLFY